LLRLFENRYFACVLLFLSALFIYSFNLDHRLYVDEFYHLIPAGSLLSDGSFSIGNGEYLRATLYTRFISLVFEVFGESPLVARYSSAVTVSLFIASFYLIIDYLVGKKEAAVSAIVLMLLPTSIYLAQFVRFYALHQLLFFIGTVAVYFLVMENVTPKKKVVCALVALCSFGLAHHFQVTTLIGALALGAWVFFVYVFRVLDAETRSKFNVGVLASLCLLGVSLFILLIMKGKLAGLIADFRYAAPWSSDNVNNYQFYHQLLRYQYPSFWTWFPVICLVSIYLKPKLATLFVTVFLGGILLFSLAGMKDERYIVYLYPFAVVITVIFCVAMLSKLKELLVEILDRIPFLHEQAGLKRVGTNSILAITILYVVVSNHAFPTSFHLLNGAQYRHEVGDWALSREAVAPLVKNADVVLTVNDVESLFYFGRFDFNFSRFNLGEASVKYDDNQDKEFVIDVRTGLPVVSEIRSLDKILGCYRSGVFLGDKRKWYKSGQGLGSDGVELLAQYGSLVEVDPRSLLVVYVWKNETLLPPVECEQVYSFKESNAQL